MAREDPQIKLRLSSGLKTRVEEEARRAGRSLNAEIVHRLEQSFISHEGLTSRFIDEVTDVVAQELSKRYGIPDIDPRRRPELKSDAKLAPKPREGES